MRRTDRELTDISQIKSILADAEVIHLGIRTDRYPYVVPTNYGYEFDTNNQLTLYIHGAPVGHKRDLIAEDGRVGFAIDTDGQVLNPKDPDHDTPSFKYRSIMGYGDAKLVDDLDQKRYALQRSALHEVGHEWSNLPDAAVEHVGIIQITVNQFTAKANPGDSQKYVQN
ncbi:pyridoxamine 5'-phosphate oxidase family protein [Lentilactobacillus hilgardii]|uniref:pyridoxamine 5'-phosphate oxidase family protein n=1 Tax=Lentilactobacillus hilgardii TaxID=1588 RepID=UPI0021C3C55F|nr:pyridoxamine 5'-phosphate oxidase family protein [Lentilactobacillus hilgardii]MCP9333181.1 pyridoxamine 5'-phosphate oxidase family protein [Lentilactobacillus hilgardii]MCP9349803.1 pyridoxamine 5'-phosphate oxidase family protein [Lentilactobacillus hilgardii]MCP9352731.1 pyridoxamine 5'-phosphate oxidase family protein [Lentilactobacillus hilgardii]